MLKKLVLPFVIFLPLSILGCTSETSVPKNDAPPKEATSTTTQPASPIQQVIALNPIIGIDVQKVELVQTVLKQNDEQITEVTLVESGLSNDSVAAISKKYQFKYANQEGWKLVSQQEQYKCARGENTTTFQTELCP